MPNDAQALAGVRVLEATNYIAGPVAGRILSDLGAEVVWLKSPDVTAAILDFAREHHVNRILVGRRGPRRLSNLWRRSITGRLLDRAADFDVEVVARDEE